MALSESGRLRFPACAGWGQGQLTCREQGGPGRQGTKSQRQTLTAQEVLCRGSRDTNPCRWGPLSSLFKNRTTWEGAATLLRLGNTPGLLFCPSSYQS